MKTIKHPLAIALFAAGLACAPGLVSAQAPETATSPAPATQPAAQVSEEKVDQFVTAYVEVQKISQDYSAKLQATEEPEKATELQQEAQTKMQKAVTKSGLSVPEYQQIASLAGQNPELRARIQEEMAN